MAFDPIGTYEHVLTVENPGTPQPDGAGGYTPVWTPLTPPTVYASITAATAADQQQLGSATVLAQATHLIRCWHHPQITTQTRLTFRGRLFTVIGIRNVDERDVSLALICAEVIP